MQSRRPCRTAALAAASAAAAAVAAAAAALVGFVARERCQVVRATYPPRMLLQATPALCAARGSGGVLG